MEASVGQVPILAHETSGQRPGQQFASEPAGHLCRRPRHPQETHMNPRQAQWISARRRPLRADTQGRNREDQDEVERPVRQTHAMYTRRGLFGTTAGLGAAALLAGCRVDAGSAAPAAPADDAPAATLGIDFGRTAFFPLLKSKTAVGRALSTTQILDSLPYLDQIRPALYNGEIRFPDTTSASMRPYPVEVGSNGEVTVRQNTFLNALFTHLRQRNVQIMAQLEGAPAQWEDKPRSHRPHLFPIPTDLPATAHAMGLWAGQYRRYPISWCMWNEPSHNLTGKPDPASVRQMADIYTAYTGAIAPRAPGALFGLAGFITPSAQPQKRLGGRTHLQATLDELRTRLEARPGTPLDHLTLNNYGEPISALIDAARNALGTDFNTVPIVQAQFGVFKPHEWDRKGYAGTPLEAALSMAALDEALRIPDLQTFTFAGWLPHMIAFRNGKAVQLPLFNALKLFARMPDHRSPVQGTLPSGLGAMASGDADRASVLVWNTTGTPHSITLDLAHLPAGAQLHIYRIDSAHGSPLQEGGAEFAPTETVRLHDGSGSLSKTVTVAGPGLVYVEAGTAPHHPVLDRGGLSAALVRRYSYADRVTDSHGTASVRGNAYGSYDAVRAIAYLGIEGEEGTALCGAQYRDLPGTLRLDLWSDRLAGRPGSAQAMFGVRVDFLLAGGPAKSVLWHGDVLNVHRTEPLPWGKGGPTADVLVHAPGLDRTRSGQGGVTLPLSAYGPPGWADSGRQAIISFWMDSTGPGSQSRFLLS